MQAQPRIDGLATRPYRRRVIDSLVPPASLVIADIGAAFLGEPPPYQPLLDKGLAHLFAFEPDLRRTESLQQRLGGAATVIARAIADGARHTLHICDHGWTSLLAPDPAALAFFNSFPQLGRVRETQDIDTARLDDIAELPAIDFLKMDVQGAELMVLQGGRTKLRETIAVQLEVSFVPLYRDQPPFGTLDLELRQQGFIPHRFVDVKRWSISPAIMGGDPRVPLNQLLEADIVYIRDPMHDALSDDQLRKLAVVAHLYKSPDLAARCLTDLEKRGAVEGRDVLLYLAAQGLKR